MRKRIDEWTNAIHQGDSLEVLDELPEESIHAIVSDPPYGLNFMGRDWDNFRRRNNENDVERDNVGGRLSEKAPASGAETDGVEYHKWCREWLEKAYRALKPGGHLVSFSGDRTYHWLATAVELSGFEYRRMNTWIYGSGFPKGRDPAYDIPWPQEGPGMYRFHSGWKTEQKPALEPICLARKPISGSNVANNIREHGTGALNIDECRINSNGETIVTRGGGGDEDMRSMGGGQLNKGEAPDNPREGRYPANVLLDEDSARALDQEVGETSDGHWNDSRNGAGTQEVYNGGYSGQGNLEERYDRNDGGPSRYFYTSKASKSERTLDGKIENNHPTVKPEDLMRWLVKLVTAEDQIVLDPFAGSGTTCKAAKGLNRRFVGIEMQERWADVARVRCGLDPIDPSNVRADDSPQSGLEAYTDGGTPD